ncbi:MAG: hypothetical protein ACI4B5_02925 [Bacteroidaceae bacterium]
MRHCWLRTATCAILIMMAALTTVQAQPQGEKFNPKEFRAKLEEFITKEVGLTSSEGKAFFPLFHEMKEKQRDLQDLIFQLKRNNPTGNATDKDYAATILKIKRLEVEKAELEEQYYKKMCKAIPARKVYQAMKAEDIFHRKMINNFMGQEKNREMKSPRGPKPTRFPNNGKE